MIRLFESKDACFGCGACRAVCPNGAIQMVSDEEGFAYPLVDPQKCVECEACVESCPGKHPIPGTAGTAFAVRCKDLHLLQSSTSGGAFSLIAQQILDRGGLVCGAVFDEAFCVKHILSDDIAPMRKSKYVQSDLQDIYGDIRQALAEGKQVLFTGTPCQCDGVRHYFGAQPQGLILMALVCRGVQSPGLWKDYVNYLSDGEPLRAYCFRDKRLKNDGHTVAYTTSRGEQAMPMSKDPFSRLYVKCLTLRPSCYSCPYTRWELPFDLTMGDFWGIEKVRPELNDGMGVSLVIARTKAGRDLLESSKSHGLVLEMERDAADQIALNEPAKQSILRKLLFRDFARKGASGVCDVPMILKKYGG